MKNWSPTVVVYHKNCPDGFGAAWAAYRRFGSVPRYVACQHGDHPPTLGDNDHVLIVDFSFSREILLDMAKTAHSIIVLDHHKTAQASLDDFRTSAKHVDEVSFDDGNIVAVFDMNRSGAKITWDFFHSVPAPKLIDLIEDYDIWQFKHAETKAFNSWLTTYPFTFEKWDEIAETSLDSIMVEADAIQRFFDKKVEEICDTAWIVSVDNYSVPMVNCSPQFSSQVGNALLGRYPDAPFSASYSDRDTIRKFSLRSEDGRADVSEIAKKFGGGGHRNAAGFAITIGE